MPHDLYIAGEDIAAGNPVIRCTHDGKVYAPPCRAGAYIGDAAELLREGMRVSVDANHEVREDDA